MRKGRSLIRKRREKIGLPPGSLVHLGEKRSEKPLITLINFNDSRLEIREVASVEESTSALSEETVTWINVDGLHQTDLMETFGAFFKIHSLVLEDILNTDHRPKMEDYDDYVFLVMKMLFYDDVHGEVQAEQVSLILGANYVLSFQEKRGDVFDGMRERLRDQQGAPSQVGRRLPGLRPARRHRRQLLRHPRKNRRSRSRRWRRSWSSTRPRKPSSASTTSSGR